MIEEMANIEEHPTKLIHRLSLLYFALIGIILYLVIVPVIFPLKFISLFYKKANNAYYLVIQKFTFIYLFLSPLKLKIIGTEKLEALQDQDYVFVSNHRSHLDVFVLLSFIKKLRVLANSYIFKVPVLGLMMRLSGHFEVEPGNVEKFNKAVQDIKLAVKLKQSVLFFPEMTRCPKGFQGISKFRLTPFKLARDLSIPVVPIVLKGTDGVWPRGVSAHDYHSKVIVTVLDPIDPKNFDSTSSFSKAVKEKMLESFSGSLS